MQNQKLESKKWLDKIYRKKFTFLISSPSTIFNFLMPLAGFPPSYTKCVKGARPMPEGGGITRTRAHYVPRRSSSKASHLSALHLACNLRLEGALQSALWECIAVADLDFPLRQKWALLFVSSRAARSLALGWSHTNNFSASLRDRGKCLCRGFSLLALEIIFQAFPSLYLHSSRELYGRFISQQALKVGMCGAYIKRLKGLFKF